MNPIFSTKSVSEGAFFAQSSNDYTNKFDVIPEHGLWCAVLQSIIDDYTLAAQQFSETKNRAHIDELRSLRNGAGSLWIMEVCDLLNIAHYNLINCLNKLDAAYGIKS